MNSFDESLEDTFRARKVRVIARDETEYTGFVERINWRDRHFILHGAENGDGEHVGAVLVSHAERVELVEDDDADRLRVERLPLDEIKPSPYAVKAFDREQNLKYIDTIRGQGVRRNFPIVRPVEEGYELVDGHKGVWACRCAGLDVQPCEIVKLSDWEATERFVHDHIPTPRRVAEDGTTEDGWYDDEEITAAIERLAADWGDRVLDLYAVAYNVDRLDLDLDLGAGVNESDVDANAG